MADQSSLNENLIALGLNTSNPQNTYTDFATQITKNQQEQASHEQALALAKEHVAQAKNQTREEGEAAAAGYNSILKDQMSPAEAIAAVKAAMAVKGVDADAEIAEWAKQLPATVNRMVVENFISHLTKESTRAEDPFVASAADAKGKKLDENGDPLVEGQTYAVIYDNKGAVKNYVRSGQVRDDGSAKLDAKIADSDEKQWQKLDKEINIAFKTRSGGLGSLSTAIFRAVRAINTIISTPTITAQDLANISQDIAGIFQGGAPTVVTARDNDYSTIFTELANDFRKYTGIIPNVEKLFGKSLNPLEETKEKLLQVLVDLRDSSIHNIKTFIESEEPAFKQIIDKSPERWADMQEKKIKFIESGILVPPGAATKLNITGAKDGIHPKEARTDHKEEKPRESAGGGTKLPSSDEIKAERKRRDEEKRKKGQK